MGSRPQWFQGTIPPMLSRSALVGLGGLAASSLLVTANARAHILLDEPPPLTDNDDAKQAPCGCIFGSAELPCSATFETTTYAPGQQIIVSFVETVDHPGEFRVAFSPKPPMEVTEEDFENAEIQITIPDEQAGGPGSVMITLPDTPCEECTIQLRQLMEGSPAPFYYSCASIAIVEGGGPGSGGAGGAPMGGNGAGAGSPAGPTGSGGDGGQPVGAGSDDDGEPTALPNPSSDGCSTGAQPAKTGGAVLVALSGLLVALRRRGRSS